MGQLVGDREHGGPDPGVLGRQEAQQRQQQQRGVEGVGPVALHEHPRSSTPFSQMSAWIWSARACHFSAYMGSSYMRASRAPRSSATQHMNLLEVKCCGSPRTSQMPRSGSSQCSAAASTWRLRTGQQRLLQLGPRPGVQQDGVQHGAPHVVLAAGCRRRCRSGPARPPRSRRGGAATPRSAHARRRRRT